MFRGRIIFCFLAYCGVSQLSAQVYSGLFSFQNITSTDYVVEMTAPGNSPKSGNAWGNSTKTFGLSTFGDTMTIDYTIKRFSEVKETGTIDIPVHTSGQNPVVVIDGVWNVQTTYNIGRQLVNGSTEARTYRVTVDGVEQVAPTVLNPGDDLTFNWSDDYQPTSVVIEQVIDVLDQQGNVIETTYRTVEDIGTQSSGWYTNDDTPVAAQVITDTGSSDPNLDLNGNLLTEIRNLNSQTSNSINELKTANETNFGDLESDIEAGNVLLGDIKGALETGFQDVEGNLLAIKSTLDGGLPDIETAVNGATTGITSELALNRAELQGIGASNTAIASNTVDSKAVLEQIRNNTATNVVDNTTGQIAQGQTAGETMAQRFTSEADAMTTFGETMLTKSYSLDTSAFQVSVGNDVIDLDPTKQGWFNDLSGWIRETVRWIATILFVLFLGKRFEWGWTTVCSTAQTRAQTVVPAVSTGLALGIAVGLTVLFAVIPATVWLYMDKVGGTSGLIFDPIAGASPSLALGIGLLDLFVPLGYLVGLVILSLAFTLKTYAVVLIATNAKRFAIG